jgi:hypothetical protein
MYEPCDALAAPRFTGPHTYARLPYVRFGPEGIRSSYSRCSRW